ncbi:Tat pathway signal protein [Campylobacter sp. MIT 99-7217]|uniref:Tat pathway signal protein n=1 Tax=Campylobacter sp. MIT 99-7217 TaxID=535091 RepID=UPI0011598618|nr:Tat pathway signal protein [Campylobacter sp. MIT 99-7217]TQR30342.1 Tat pathway signal protein [Campylobacter sp. MIT 99-7217]
MQKNARRAFLKKSLQVGATAGLAVTLVKANFGEGASQEKNVVLGDSKKEEVLYEKSMHWEKYYKIAY